jgi:quercetin dioxygenase-like cupin family protein
MRYALHADDAADGRLFEVGVLTQRVVDLRGDGGGEAADELLYVLSGAGSLTVAGAEHALRPGVAVYVAAGELWQAEGDARAVSVLVHDPEPAAGHEALDLEAAEAGTATAGRAFLLGPECRSATQFIGLIPPGRAPDHYHEYDEVIYVLDGEGELVIDGEATSVRAGSCIHLPRTLVHCLANTGDQELRVLGVFRPAGSPAEAYYPDGTLAVVPETEG